MQKCIKNAIQTNWDKKTPKITLHLGTHGPLSNTSNVTHPSTDPTHQFKWHLDSISRFSTITVIQTDTWDWHQLCAKSHLCLMVSSVVLKWMHICIVPWGL